MNKTLGNPTDKEITVKYKGTEYTLPANGELEVAETVATFWISIHSFLSISEGKVVQETPKSPVEDSPIVEEGPKEEAAPKAKVVEEPKKKTRAKKK